MRNLLTVLCMALSACAHSALPSEVQSFVEQREACDHFRGEFPDPPDPDRTLEVLKMIDKYCNGTDARLAELRERHHANSTAIKRLSEFETVTERKRK